MTTTTRRLAVLSTVILGLATLPALAQDGTFPPPAGPGGARGGDQPRPGMRGNPEQMVERMMSQDQNGDGKLSRDELTGPFGERLFDRADTNGDGVLDRAELEEVAKQFQGRGRGEGPAGAGGPGGPGGPGAPGGAPADLEGTMKQANRAYRALRGSAFDESSREQDLASVQALEGALLACKAMPAPMPMPPAAKERFGGDEKAYRRDFRVMMLRSTLKAMELEMAILEGDSARAKTLVGEIHDSEEAGHDIFQNNGGGEEGEPRARGERRQRPRGQRPNDT